MKARFRPVALYGSLRLDQAHRESSVPCPNLRAAGSVSAETNNGHRRILAELSRPSEFRFPETETVSTETRLTGSYNAASSKDLPLDETIRPLKVRLDVEPQQVVPG